LWDGSVRPERWLRIFRKGGSLAPDSWLKVRRNNHLIKGIKAIEIPILLVKGVFILIHEAAIFYTIAKVFCKPKLVTDTDQIVFFVVPVVYEF
jgi:hypothetical protein